MIEQVKEILLKVPEEMMRDEAFCLLVGQVYFNLTDGGSSGLNFWVENFEGTFTEDELRILYETMKKTFHTISSIKFFLLNDDRCSNFFKTEREEKLINCLLIVLENCDERMVANYLTLKYKEILIANKKDILMFNVKENLWHHVGTEIVKNEIDEMVDFANEKIKICYRDMMESHDEAHREKLEGLIKKYRSAAYSLSQRKTIDKVFRNVRDSAVDYFSVKKWDALPNYTGTINGVIICQGREVFFRKALPEDFITKRLNAKYTTEALKLPEFLDWFQKLFPDDELRHYVYKLLSSLLIDGNIDKSIYFLSGESGNNSKSCFINCIQNLLNPSNYACKVPASLFTQRLNKAHEANSVMADLCSSRYGSFDEPEAGDQFVCSNIKVISGNDFSSVRKLYKDSSSMEIKSTIFGGMNFIPPFRDGDQAVKNRVKIIPFITVWSDDASEDPEQQREERRYKMDPEFISHVKEFSEALLYMMVQMFPYWYDEKLTDIPEAVKKANEEYWNETDYFDKWAKISFEKFVTQSKQKGVAYTYKLEDTYTDFCNWFRLLRSNKPLPDVTTYRRHITQVLGNVHYTAKSQRWTNHAYVYHRYLDELSKESELTHQGDSGVCEGIMKSMRKIDPTSM